MTDKPTPTDAEVENLRKALVYAAFALHDTPQYMLAPGITLIDGDTVRVSRDGWTVEASTDPRRQPSAPAPRDLGCLLSAHKQLGATSLAVLDCVETHPGIAMITRINTPAKFRGQGIASALLNHVLARADRLGVVMTLSIQPSDGLDHAALDAWYRRHGFEPRSCGDGFYERDFRGSAISRDDAAVVLAAMDSGDWRVWRAPWQYYMTTTANRQGAWVAERVRAPFCAVRGGGQYGPRHWEGATAIAALKAGCDDLGVDISEYGVAL